MRRNFRLELPNRTTVMIIVVVGVLLAAYLKFTSIPAPDGDGRVIAEVGDPAYAAMQAAESQETLSAEAPSTPEGDADVDISGEQSPTSTASSSSSSTSTSAAGAAGESAKEQEQQQQRKALASSYKFVTRTPGNPMGRATFTDAFGRTVIEPLNAGGDVVRTAPLPTGEEALTSPLTATGLDANNNLAMPPRVDVEWQRIKKELPKQAPWDAAFSPTQGPVTTSDSVPVGFSRTPVGAAVAGWMMYQIIGGGGVLASRAVDAYVVDPAVRQRARAMVAQPESPQWPVGENLGQSFAFKVVDYTPDKATVVYALGEENNPRSLELTMVFVDGTWKLETPAKGKVGTINPADLGSFTRW